MKVEYIDHMGSDLAVVKAARVSFANADDAERTTQDNQRLINYLAKHNHWTPFAHTQITLRMTAPIPIRTQCFKHKFGFVENEESRRYIDNEPEYFVPMFRQQVANKKQGSGDQHSHNLILQGDYIDYMESTLAHYNSLLEQGVCEEQARFVLPQGCMVNWYWTGSLAAFARFFKQRTDLHAQLEIQELAKQVGTIIQPLYPLAWDALTTEE